ncbi:hypothetical protein [Ferruginibacter sp.]|uniref:hypothetical protein n=1 Tax=Ferruginibacter sp. TaxID=1940288 RepID=UPI0019B7DA9E|nr:hypothetical protein [Ferruginibacter sp.]MBC7628619.1 hypothetical protein [Ferruginibacter sp.]
MRNKSIFIYSFWIFLSLVFCCNLSVLAQNSTTTYTDSVDPSSAKDAISYKKQRDIIDIALLLLHKDPNKRLDSTQTKSMKIRLSISPIIEYTISTGFTAGLAAGGAFVTSLKGNTNISSFLGAIKYTEKKQFLLPVQSILWTPGNKYNFGGDWRYLNYPQDTYGLGGFKTTADRNIITYKYIRFYEFALKKVWKDFYIGLGYQLDYHWTISELDVLPGRITDFQLYGFHPSSFSSGIALDILYDSRVNSINPEGGSFFANFKFLQNSRRLGSSSKWNSVLIDVRKYLALPHKNVLAFWLYSVLTLNGTPPYLDLPGTGNDSYNNAGRGYMQGRFIGKKYIDLETEFRFGITKNGLLGGVIFCSAGSVSELNTNKFETIFPSVGAGLRIKFNKFSKTNVCLDYGIGIKGSRGFTGNLGEVF